MEQKTRFSQTWCTEAVIRRKIQKVVFRKMRKSDLKKVVFLIFFLIVMFRGIFGVTQEYGTNMEPAIEDRDFMLYYRLQNSYIEGNVVVYEKQGATRIGRIVAIPGESVEITKDGKLVINGYIQADISLDERYNLENGDGTGEIQLKDQEYYILNDDCKSIEDSRSFGVIKEKEIQGVVITVIRRRNI